MATTSDNLAAGKASAGQGGPRHHGRFGLTTKLVAGVSALCCAATLAFIGQYDPPTRITSQAAPTIFSGTVAVAAVDTASDLGTDYDPFVIANAQPRYEGPATAINAVSDLGTDYDPFVIANAQPRYVATPTPSAPANFPGEDH